MITLILKHSLFYITWITYLNFFNTVMEWGCANAHQWVWLYIESPLLAFLLLCVANTAPPHNTVLQRTSCTKRSSEVTASLLWMEQLTNHTPIWVSTFMPKAFEQCHIIQPQHLTHIDVIWKNSKFICRILEEKVIVSKDRWGEELEALLLSSLSAKQCLNNIRQWFKNSFCWGKRTLMDIWKQSVKCLWAK